MDFNEFMNKEDAAVVGVRPPADTSFSNSFNQFMDEENERIRQQLAASLTQAQKGNADEYAKTVAASKALKVEPGAVEGAPDEAAALLIQQQAEAMVDKSPALAGRMQDPNFARLANDDSPILQRVEGTVTGIERSAIGRITEPVMREFARAKKGLTLMWGELGLWRGAEAAQAERLAQQQREVERYEVPPDIEAGMQAITEASTFGEAATEIQRNPEAVLEIALGSLGGSVASLAGFIGGGLLTRTPAGRALGTGAGSFITEYGAALDEAITERTGQRTHDPVDIRAALEDPGLMAAARQKGVMRGISVGAFDALSAGFAGKLMGMALSTGAKVAAGRVAGAAVGEVAVQMGAGAAGEALAQATTGEFKPGEIILEALIEGPTAAIEVPANINAYKQAKTAEKNTEIFTKLSELAKASKLAQRDPQSFAEFVQDAADGGPVQDVYVNGQQLAQVLQQTGTPVPESVNEQLAEAVSLNTDVVIPIGEYEATLDRSDAGPLLMPHLKTLDPETHEVSWSQLEAQTYMEGQTQDLKVQADKIRAEHAENAAYQNEISQVEQYFTEQFATANRWAPQFNAGYAGLLRDFYTSMAPRGNMTPMQMLQAYPLNITAEPMVDMTGMDQGVTVTGVHYGNLPGLAELDTSHFGEGARAEERRRIPSGTPVSKRASFYLAEGGALPTPEDVVTGQNVYSAQLQNVYDFEADPDGLIDIWRARRKEGEFLREGVHETTALEQMVIDAGYDGYVNRENGTVTMFGDKVPVQFLGNRATAGTVMMEQSPANKARELALSATVERHLKPEERAKLRKNTAQRMVDLLSKLPPAEEYAAVAQAGQAKRGWYAQSAEAMVNVFGPDAPRFAALLAALSPQTSVENNLTTALNVWKNWIASGRVVKRQEIRSILSKSVQGSRGSKSVLYAWVNNTVRALQAQDPGRIMLSGPKVNSFYLNLVGVTDEVTNDAWMASFAAINQKLLGGALNVAGTDPGKSPAYLALSVRVREAAELITATTGEQWTPAEVQETVWSWSKMAYETATADTSVLDLVFDAKITDELIASTPDFRSLFSTPGNRKILEAAGYGEQLEALRRSDATAGAQVKAAGGQTAPAAPSDQLIAAAVRLDKLRFARIEGRVAARNVLNQGTVGEVANPDVNEGPMVNIGLATNDGKGISVEQALEALEAKGVTPVRYEVHQSDTEQTLVAQTSRALTPAEADAVSKELGQEAIAQVDEKGKGELYGPGADAWRPFNPQFFVSLGGARMAQTPPDDPYHPARGHIYFGEDITQGATIALLKNADLSTTFHELGHFFLEVMTHMAAQPNAPAGISADMAAVLKWFGVGSLQEWRAMHIDEKRTHHEKFARGFEAYIFEGNAPSLELQGLFSKFRIWLMRVYKSLKDLNVRLTPEVRTVFEKMLASEAQIANMKQARAMMPLFSTPEEANASAEEWVAYQALGAQATEDAVNELQSRTLGDLKWVRTASKGHLKRLQDEASEKRAAIRKEVTEEVDGLPVYRVIEHLRTAAKEEKLSLPALKDMYGTEANAIWRYFNTGKTSMVTGEDGRHPDQVAAQFEFTSGDEMVRKILGADSREEMIDGVTDQRMLERYAELTDERTVQRAADKAINNEARAKFVATELRFLSRVGRSPSERTPRGGTINVLAKAAKLFAEGIIAGKRISTIRPAQYKTAETLSAKAAIADPDPSQKALHKRNQLLNMYANKAAENVLDEVRDGVHYLKRVQNSKTIDTEYLDQIHAALERFDLRHGVTAEELDRRQGLQDWIKEQHERGFEPQLDPLVLAESKRKHYGALTVEEFRGLVDSIKNIEHIGRLKHKLLTAKDEREFEAIVKELAQSIRDNANRTQKDVLEPEPGVFAGMGAELRTLSSLVREMDGGKMGGKFWNLLVRPMNTAGNIEVEMGAEATKKLGALLKPLLKEGRLSKKTFIKAIDDSLSKEGRLTVALNAGNASNLQRLMGGEGWSREQVQGILDTLTKTEMDFVQGVWNLFEHYRPLIAAKEKRVSGAEPEWIEATPLITKHGTYRGGYYPVKYNTRRSTKAQTHADAEEARHMLHGAYTTATTRRTFVKSRVDEVYDRPLTYRLDGLFQGVNEVIHDLAWHEWLIDANRLLRNGAVGNAIVKHYGPEVRNALKSAVEDIAKGDNYAQDASERWIARLRHGVTIVGLGWNPITAALQPVGLTQSMSLIGPQWVLKGMNQWMTSPEATMEMIKEKWPFMRHRASTMQRDIREMQGRISGKSTAKEFMDASHFIMLQKMQVIADVPTLLGAYERAKSEGKDEDTARAYAETAVLDAQGGGQIKDLAGVQRGSEFKKVWTTFYSFFNKTWNVSAEKTRGAMTVSEKLQLPGHYMLLFVIPAVLSALIKGVAKGDFDEDEPDEIAAKLAMETIGYTLGSVVGLRELGGTLQGYQYSGAAGARVFGESNRLVQQIMQGEADEGLARSLNQFLGIIFKYPAGQVERTARGIVALEEGEAENPAVILFGPEKKQ